MSDCDFEIQCLKSVNKQKTQFVAIEDDISLLNVENIIGKLPEPMLGDSTESAAVLSLELYIYFHVKIYMRKSYFVLGVSIPYFYNIKVNFSLI